MMSSSFEGEDHRLGGRSKEQQDKVLIVNRSDPKTFLHFLLEVDDEETWDLNYRPPPEAVRRPDALIHSDVDARTSLMCGPSPLETPVFDAMMYNLPHGIDESTLLATLKDILPIFFDYPDVNVKKFKSHSKDGVERTTALLCNVRGTIQALHRRSFKMELEGPEKLYHIVFKEDAGINRDDDGGFADPKSGMAFLDESTVGHVKSFGIQLFKKCFRDMINMNVLNMKGLTSLTACHSSLTSAHLSSNGLYYVQDEICPYFVRVESASLLEAIQLIRVMNGKKINGEGLFFLNWKGDVASNCFEKKGLGHLGLQLKFDEWSHELDLCDLDPDILDQDFIASYNHKCSRCRKRYQLVRVSLNLDYLVAICSCQKPTYSYKDWNESLVDFESPLHHPDENDTRLWFGQGRKYDGKLTTDVNHPRITASFPSLMFLSNTLAPILQDEKAVQQYIASQNRKNGVISLCKRRTNKEFLNNYVLRIVIREDAYWSMAKTAGFAEASIVVKMDVDDILEPSLKSDHVTLYGYCLKVLPSSADKTLRIYYEVLVQPKHTFNQAWSTVEVVPHANIKVHLSKINYLRGKLINPLDGHHMLSKLLLRHLATPEEHVHADQPDDEDPLPTPLPLDVSQLDPLAQSLVGKLNREQKTGLELSLKNPITVIHGPPGTGKSHVTSSIAFCLASYQDSTVICTASSNDACDNLYWKIVATYAKVRQKASICRVYSRNHEQFLATTATSPAPAQAKDNDMVTLHGLLKIHPDYLPMNERWIRTKNLLKNNREYELNETQRKDFFSHVSNVEGLILKQFKIVVLTVDCISSGRISYRRRDEVNDDQLNIFKRNGGCSVLVDEAGVLDIATTITLEKCKARKFVFIGDHKQLPPVVRSSAANKAGLSKSFMEHIVQQRERLGVPMIVLTQQHRAHKSIADLVSNLTYGGQVETAKIVNTRKEVATKRFLLKFPRFQQNRILVKYNVSKETVAELGHGFINIGEAEIAVRTVVDFRKFFTPHHMTVITFYEAQRRLILQLLSEKGITDVACKTVDSMQGDENTCTIVCFTRSNLENEVGFLISQNRVNVAISRARELLVLLVNLRMLRDSGCGHLSRLEQYAQCKRVVEFVKVDKVHVLESSDKE